jgi:hypothetical protein
MSSTDEPYVTFSDASRAIGMSRERVRKVCIDAGVAVRWGGTDAHPYLKVKLSEAKRAVDAQRYVRPRKPERVAGRRLAAVNNSDVTC